MIQTFIDGLRDIIIEGTLLTDEPLSAHTSFQVGGKADVFVMPKTKEEIRDAIAFAKAERMPYYIIGNGSNLLVSDDGFRGMIIQIGKNFQDIEISGDMIMAKAGALLSKTARAALDSSLTGFEFAAGIPGSVGGAVCMNAGAYDGEMKGVLVSAEVITPDGEFLTLSAEELDLSYRHSCIFEKGYIVVSAAIQLKQGDRDVILARMQELAAARKSKQPLEYPSAGSTFKRPAGYFAGKLIQDAGLKGFTVGGAQVSEKHSGFVINRGGATAKDIASLIEQVQKKVYEQSGVKLETEVRFVGF